MSFFDYTVAAYEGYFPDVAEEAWYAAYVEAARQMHLIEGYLDGTFQPENPITRAEACAIVNRTLGRIPVKDRLLSRQNMVIWPDCDADSWYYADMMEATEQPRLPGGFLRTEKRWSSGPASFPSVTGQRWSGSGLMPTPPPAEK